MQTMNKDPNKTLTHQRGEGSYINNFQRFIVPNQIKWRAADIKRTARRGFSAIF